VQLPKKMPVSTEFGAAYRSVFRTANGLLQKCNGPETGILKAIWQKSAILLVRRNKLRPLSRRAQRVKPC
jgi:hypothetical protein